MKLSVDIEKKLGDFCLQVAFTAEDEVMAVLGASGCGKSITLKCIAGIETPDRGRIVLGERVLFDSELNLNLSPQQRDIGYLFQSYALFPNMTVAENIGIGIKRDKTKAEKNAIVQDKIKSFCLQGMEQKRPFQLSGGQQQRVALARILASDPQIIMLDEPFSALDSYLKWQLEQELMDVLEQYRGTTLFVSHNRDEVYRLCDKIVVLDHGHMDACCDKETMFANPQTLSTALLTGCKNISVAQKTGEYSLYAADWGVHLVTAVPVDDNLQYVGVRAHYFHYLAPEDVEEHTENIIQCQIKRIIEQPFDTVVVFQHKVDADRHPCVGNKTLRWEFPQTLHHFAVEDNLILQVAKEDIMLLY